MTSKHLLIYYVSKKIIDERLRVPGHPKWISNTSPRGHPFTNSHYIELTQEDYMEKELLISLLGHNIVTAVM